MAPRTHQRTRPDPWGKCFPSRSQGLTFTRELQPNGLHPNDLAGKVYSNNAIAFWNTCMFSCVFVTVAFTIWKMRALVKSREQAVMSANRAKQEAEKANQAKDRFLAVLSHEL